MSNIVTNAVKHWQGTPTQKLVLMCLADGAGDDGAVPAWRSSAGSICSWTCLKRTAVTEALKSLEAAGLVAVDRPRGQISTIRLVFEVVDELPNPPGKRCTPADGVPRETVDHPPGKRQGVPRQTVGSTPGNGHLTPLHQTPVIHQERKRTRKRDAPSVEKPMATVDQLVEAGFPADVANEFIAHKAALKAPLTERAWRDHLAEALKAGWSPLQAAEKVMAKSWKGFEARYVASEKPPGQSQLSFAQQDEAARRKRWEEMTGRKWPESRVFDMLPTAAEFNNLEPL